MRELFSKLLRYGMTGGIAAIVDAGGFELLVRAGLGIAEAGTASFCVAAFVNYCLTSRFVFGQGRTAVGFAFFFVIAIIGLAVNVGVTLAGVYWFDLPPIVAKVSGIGTAFLINFGLNTAIVFRRERWPGRADSCADRVAPAGSEPHDRDEAERRHDERRYWQG